jgi:predicted secreted protein
LGEVDPDSGAPRNPRLPFKMGLATAVAAILWLAFYVVVALGFFQV